MSARQQFKQLISDYDPDIQEWALSARDLVLSVQPQAREEVETSWGGYLLFKQGAGGGNTVCFISAHNKHVSLGFSEGAELADPAGLLQGSGKRQRHVKIKKAADLERAGLKELLTEAWSRQPDGAVLEAAVARVRELCLAFPEAAETVAHGHPTFKVGKKSFAVYGIYSPSVAFKADMTLQAELEGDERFFPTPYMAHRGWLSVRVDEETDWDQVADLLRQSYLQVANKKQKAALESVS